MDPYKYSTVLQKIQARQRTHSPVLVAFFDIDFTLTGNNHAAMAVRNKLEELGYIVIFITARTEEMVMSSREYTLSQQRYNFGRAKPKLGKSGRINIAVEPETVISPGLLDPDIIAGTTGTRIFFHKADGGYCEDMMFRNKHITSALFKRITHTMISHINKAETIARTTLLEHESNFHKGLTNVFPPDFQVQLDFKNLPHKIEFLWQLHVIKEQFSLFRFIPQSEIVLKELSYVDNSDPDKNYYSIFLVPNGGKLHAIDYLYSKLEHCMGEGHHTMHSLTAGDSWADLQMGLYGGTQINKQSHLLIVGGSRLTPYLIHSSKYDFYAGEPLKPIKQNMIPIEHKGFFRFPLLGHEKILIIGDLAYPGTRGPETILAFLSEKG